MTNGGCRNSVGPQTQPAVLTCSFPDTIKSSGSEHTQLFHTSGRSTGFAAEYTPEHVHCCTGYSSTVQSNHSSTERFLPKKGQLKKKNLQYCLLYFMAGFFPYSHIHLHLEIGHVSTQLLICFPYLFNSETYFLSTLTLIALC